VLCTRSLAARGPLTWGPPRFIGQQSIASVACSSTMRTSNRGGCCVVVVLPSLHCFGNYFDWPSVYLHLPFNINMSYLFLPFVPFVHSHLQTVVHYSEPFSRANTAKRISNSGLRVKNTVRHGRANCTTRHAKYLTAFWPCKLPERYVYASLDAALSHYRHRHVVPPLLPNRAYWYIRPPSVIFIY